MTPFIIYALPRSRTAWLSKYLSYGDYECAHDQARYIRSMDDVRGWLAQDFTGTAETAGAPWWRIVRHIRPDIRTAVVRRPVGQVFDSLMRLPLDGVCTFDADRLRRQLQAGARRLDRIARESGVLAVEYADLATEPGCASVFEHCLHHAHDAAWWRRWAPLKVEANMRAMMRYWFAHEPQMARARREIGRQMRGLLRQRVPQPSCCEADGVSFQEEPFDVFWRDGQKLFAEHAAEVGPRPGVTLDINWPAIAAMDRLGLTQFVTARCNGRMIGYIGCSVAQSIEDRTALIATQFPIFVCKDFRDPRRSMGLRLQKASNERLKAKGVRELVLRAGVRGSGPKLGALYRKIGAEPYGEMYRLPLAGG